MKVRQRLRAIDRRTVAAVLLVLVVSGALVGVIAVAVNAFVFNTDTEREQTPYGRFQFDQHAATVPADGGSEQTVVAIARESGPTYDQGNVTVQVNGKPAWDVQTDDDGTAVLAEPWSDEGEPLDGTSVRIVAYGAGEAGDPYLNATAETGGENESDENESGGTTGVQNATEYERIEPGDVVEVVWHDDGSDEMTVLQRYVVEAPQEEAEEEAADNDTESDPPPQGR